MITPCSEAPSPWPGPLASLSPDGKEGTVFPDGDWVSCGGGTCQHQGVGTVQSVSSVPLGGVTFRQVELERLLMLPVTR